MKIDAIVLSYKREGNLPKVIKGLIKQSIIDKIYVFHNYPSKKKFNNCINIYSDSNFRCIARHAIGLLTDKKYVMFVDDDIELKSDLSEKIKKAVKYDSKAIIGLYGINVHYSSNNNNLYNDKYRCEYSKYLRYVDIVKGRVHVVKKEHLIFLFDYLNKMKDKLDSTSDDLYLNLASQLKNKTPSLIIPLDKREIKELPDSFGLNKRSDHTKRRSRLVNKFIKNGWKSLVNTKKYYLINKKLGGSNFIIDNIKLHLEDNNDLILNKLFNDIKINNVPNIYIYNYAGILKRKGSYPKSLKYYKRVLKTKSEDKLKGLACYHMGEIYLRTNKIKKANSHLKSCIKYIPDHKAAKELLKNIVF